MSGPYTTGQIAKLASVNINVVKRWIADGLLEAYKLPAGHFRISADAFVAFLTEHDMPIPESLAAEKKKVLIIDDDAIHRDLLGKYLQSKTSFEIHSAADGFEGLVQIGSLKPDLILLDISMPHMDGFALLNALGKRPDASRYNIVVITGNKDDQTKDQLAKMGISNVLFKPYLLEELDPFIEPY